MHPYIITLIAEDHIAELRAQAASDREAKAAWRRRKAAKQAQRARANGHRVTAHAPSWSSLRHVGHPAPEEDRQLVSVGRAGSDDCL